MITKLLETPTGELSWGDRIRQQKILTPFLIFFYFLIIIWIAFCGEA